MDHLNEVQVGTTVLCQGSFLHVRQDDVKLPGGAQATREYVVHPGAVMVVPLLEDSDGAMRLVLEQQYRYPLQRVMIEFPAGKLEPGEDSLHCAKRELLEETGYSAVSWARAGTLHPCIAYSTEFIDIWFARGLTLGTRHLDDGEFLDVFLATPEELVSWCYNGRVTDGKTLTATLWLEKVLSGTWVLDWDSTRS